MKINCVSIALARRVILGALAGIVLLTVPAAAQTIKIVAFGTSNTLGRYVAPTDSYPSKLEAALKAHGHDVHVINAGRNGDTVAGGLARLGTAVPEDTAMAIVEFGVNDRRAGVAPARIQAGLDQIVDRLRERHIQVLVANYMDVTGGPVARGTYFVLFDVAKFSPTFHVANDPYHHLNAAGYDLVVARMLPAVEALIARVKKGDR
jgi:acyl-CoA thioesterase I